MFQVKAKKLSPLTIQWSSQPDAYLILDEICLIGKDSICNIQLQGEGVDPRQARIEKKMDHFLLRDLRSSTGVLLNGVRVFEAPLQPGDEIQIGSHQLQVLSKSSRKEQSLELKSNNELWQRQLKTLPKLARQELPILILGPSGSGKELIAKAIHENSYRRRGPFVSINCSALTDSLIESELFGHIKGSFTGAIQDRKGALEAARGGTLFLDEIGDLPLPLQAKLLRALENQEIRPVGSDRTIKTDVRIVSATHQNLAIMVQTGNFRSDLFFRLNVLSIKAPGLKERMEDFESLLYRFCRERRISFKHAAIQKLKSHHWPGNIRELKNAVARASALFQGEQVQEEDVCLLIEDVATNLPNASYSAEMRGPAPSVLKEIEKEMILRRLAANRGNQRQTAVDLGMPKSTLHDRLKFYKIDPKTFHGVAG